MTGGSHGHGIKHEGLRLPRARPTRRCRASRTAGETSEGCSSPQGEFPSAPAAPRGAGHPQGEPPEVATGAAQPEALEVAAAAGVTDSARPSIADSRRDERGLFEPAGRVPERAGCSAKRRAPAGRAAGGRDRGSRNPSCSPSACRIWQVVVNPRSGRWSLPPRRRRLPAAGGRPLRPSRPARRCSPASGWRRPAVPPSPRPACSARPGPNRH